MSRGT